MCGLAGYIGNGWSRGYVIQGLSRLEYRGYDSAGFSCLNDSNNAILYCKATGHLANLIQCLDAEPIDGHLGIGHTRWATHGAISTENTHPHFDCHKKISIAHNGIIENYRALKEELIEHDHTFKSQTDTEVVAHLLESLIAQKKSFKEAFGALVNRLEGAYALVCISQDFPDELVIARARSPLCIGIGNDEFFVASDLLAFVDKTNKVVFLPDKSYAVLKKGEVELYDFSGKALPFVVQEVDTSWIDIEKKGFEHFMLKEIYEQKCVIQKTLASLQSLGDLLWSQLKLSKEQVKNLTSVTMIGCGTSWHAARIAQFFFEEITKIPAKVALASEFRLMSFFPDPHGIYIAITQSGETADTLEALRLVNSFDLKTIGLTNVASSTVAREADGCLVTQAGQEIAVASTKAFSTQIITLFWLAHKIAFEKGLISDVGMDDACRDILVAAEILETSIENYKAEIVSTLAARYAQYKKCIFLGRHISYPFAMESALKLKEISYIFAQCYPAGELKHGPIALIDADTPIFLFSSLDPHVYPKLVSNAQEVKARKGHLVIFAFEGQDELMQLADQLFVIPRVHPLLAPLAMTGLMQFFVYQIAKELGCPIDKPRNLAKSVTVE